MQPRAASATDEARIAPEVEAPPLSGKPVPNAPPIKTATPENRNTPEAVSASEGFYKFRPNLLTTDAKAFQYKGGGDASGVTDRLLSIKIYL